MTSTHTILFDALVLVVTALLWLIVLQVRKVVEPYFTRKHHQGTALRPRRDMLFLVLYNLAVFALLGLLLGIALFGATHHWWNNWYGP